MKHLSQYLACSGYLVSDGLLDIMIRPDNNNNKHCLLPPLFPNASQLPRIKSLKRFCSSATLRLTSHFTSESGSLIAVHNVGSMGKIFLNLKKRYFCNISDTSVEFASLCCVIVVFKLYLVFPFMRVNQVSKGQNLFNKMLELKYILAE